jgi:diguanylate cyclase (GGDEF)-like protein
MQPLMAAPFVDFREASRAVLEHLREHVGMALWMVTRRQERDWIVLDAAQAGDVYAVEPSLVLPWFDSFCVRMVAGKGPRCAPRSNEVAAYREAPIGRRLPIASYVGVPLYDAGGGLFGTLCAIDPAPRDADLELKMPMVELAARLLATILDRERAAEDARRRAERAELGANTDLLTNLASRRAWEAAVDREEARCKRYGDTISVLMVDLDELKRVNDERGHAAGDALIQAASKALRTPLRETDFVARIGGDEFGILAPHVGLQAAHVIKARLEAALALAGCPASIGIAQRRPDATLRDALKEADAAMYAEKQRRKQARGRWFP